MLYSNRYMGPPILDEIVGENMDGGFEFSRFGSWLQFLVPAHQWEEPLFTR